MQFFKTGRTRTVTFSGVTAGRYYNKFYVPPMGPPTWQNNNAELTVGSNNCVMRAYGSWTSPNRFWNVLIVWDSGGVHTGDFQQASFSFFGPPKEWDLSLAGSWSISIPVEEVVSFTGPASPSDFPSYGGAPIADPPIGESIVRLYEVMQLGGTATATMTIGGVTATASIVIASADEVSYLCGVTCQCEGVDYAAGSTNTGGIAGALSSSMLFNGVSMGGGSISNSDAHHSGSAGAGASAACDAGLYQTIATNGARPIRSYNLSGVVQAADQPYPSAMTVRVDRYLGASAQPITVSAGTFSDSYSQRSFGVAVQFLHGAAGGPPINWAQDSIVSDSADEWANVRCWLDNAALVANHEDTRNWRCLLRGWSYNSFSVVQTSPLVVDDGTSLTPAAQPFAGAWTSLAHCSLAVAGGGIQITVSGGTGRARRTFTPRWGGFSGFRLWQLQVTADVDNSPYQVRVTDSNGGVKLFTQNDFGETLVARTMAHIADLRPIMDLCGPQTPADSVDPTDTKWPLPTVDGNMWGVTNAVTVDIEGLADGVTYVVHSIDLQGVLAGGTSELSHSYLSFLPSFDNWVIEKPPAVAGDVTTTSYALLGLDGDTDGRRSVEELVARKTVVETPTVTTTSYADNPLSAWINILGNSAGDTVLEGNPPNSGWLATANGALAVVDPANGGPLSDYLNNNRPSVWAWGGGALFRASATTIGINRYTGTALTVYAQALFDSIDWIPECGDVFGVAAGGASGPIELRAAAFLRAQGWGLVEDETGFAGDTVAVQVTDTLDASDAGGTGTGILGEYLSVLPFGKGLHNIKVTPAGSGVDYTRVWTHRHRWRVCFRVPGGTETNPWNLEDSWGQYHRTSVRRGRVRYRRAAFPTPATSSGGWVVNQDISDGPDDRDPRPARDYRARLHLLFHRHDSGGGGSDDVYEITSDDDGDTWSDPVVAFAGGTHPTVSEGLDGSLVRAAYVSGAIEANYQAAGDIDPSVNYNFQDDMGADLSVEDDTFHLMHAFEGASRWFLTVRILGEAAPSDWFSGDDSRTWTRIT